MLGVDNGQRKERLAARVGFKFHERVVTGLGDEKGIIGTARQEQGVLRVRDEGCLPAGKDRAPAMAEDDRPERSVGAFPVGSASVNGQNALDVGNDQIRQLLGALDHRLLPPF